MIVDLENESGIKSIKNGTKRLLKSYMKNTHTHLDANWLVGFLPIENSLGVKGWTAGVFMDWGADLLPFTTDDNIGV